MGLMRRKMGLIVGKNEVNEVKMGLMRRKMRVIVGKNEVNRGKK